MTPEIKALFASIKTFAFDVDGVMTDGSVMMLSSGESIRTFCIKDGYALQLAKKMGYNIVIISGGSSDAVRKRFQFLGIHDIYLKVSDKVSVFDEYMLTYHLDPATTLYMGDDLPDYDVMLKCGLPCAPANAAPEIKAIAKYVSPQTGGDACVRDVIQKVMELQGTWFSAEGHSQLDPTFQW